MSAGGKIDVCIITKNSMEPCLPENLLSIYREVPINRLIVVDGYSNDGTIEYIERFCKDRNIELIIEFDDGTRATARNKALRRVKTDIFAFIDTDVILCRGWFSKMIRYFRDRDVGMVWGLAYMDRRYNPLEWDIYRTQILLLGVSEEEGMAREARRGYLHDTLIKREAVEGLYIPPELHILEDNYIKEYVVKRGYRYVVARDAYCLHKFRSSLGSEYLVGILGRRYNNFFTPSYIVRKVLKSPIIAFSIMLYTRNLDAALYKLLRDANLVMGFLYASRDVGGENL